MYECISAFVESFADNVLIRFIFIVPIFVFIFSSISWLFSRVFLDDEFSLLGSLFVLVLDVLKYCVSTVLRFFRCFRLLYKLGLAEEGRDFVNCGEQECCSCPFADKCPDYASRKEVDSDA